MLAVGLAVQHGNTYSLLLKFAFSVQANPLAFDCLYKLVSELPCKSVKLKAVHYIPNQKGETPLLSLKYIARQETISLNVLNHLTAQV